ncbi:hypothetical protein A2635_04190 [Candidatus Peribacteria bacterium RIFCSPHIGHO2_01_FULL_51_9]|nr:MAG: hypothetical protein A2635_04190 [Candidatus Peribacteria bacterium RIFCSPHIGHO2_01_FULL_51_9]
MRKILSLITGFVSTTFFVGVVAADGMASSTPLPLSGNASSTSGKTVLVSPVVPATAETSGDPQVSSTSASSSVDTLPYPTWIGGFGNGPKDFGTGSESMNIKPVQRVPTCGCAQPVSRDRPTRRSIIRAYYEQMEKRIAALMG